MKDPLKEHLDKILKNKKVKKNNKVIDIEEVYDLVADYIEKNSKESEELSLKELTSKGNGFGNFSRVIDANLVSSILHVIESCIEEIICDYDADESITDYDDGRISAFTACQMMLENALSFRGDRDE